MATERQKCEINSDRILLSLWFDDCKTVKFQKLSTNCVSFKDFLVDEVKQGKETAKMPEAILDKIFWSQNTHR